MKNLKRISDWVQVFLMVVLILITIPYTPLLWKPLAPDQKSFVIMGVYFLTFLLGISILIYLIYYKKKARISSYLWLLIVTILYIQAFNSLNEFPIEKIHLIEYGVLGFLVFKALKNDLKDLSIYIWSGLIIFYVGIIDETVQWITPNRVGTIEDVWLNVKSGILVLMLIELVIRPREIERKIYSGNIKKIYIFVSLALVTSGVFMNFIHDFGCRFMINNSTEIYSHFPKEELISINSFLKKDLYLLNKTAQRLESPDKPNKNISLEETNAMVFFREAGKHKWERDYAFSKSRFLKSLKEQIILKDYYSSVLCFDSFKWRKKRELLVETLAKKEKEDSIYISPVSGILITKFSKAQMWIFIGIAVVIFMLLFIRQKE